MSAGSQWMGMTDWAFFNLDTFGLGPNQTYFGSTGPIAFGSFYDLGAGKPHGYLLDSTDTFVVQVDMQGFLSLPRQGTSGDATHQPTTDPWTVGILSPISIP